MKGKENTPFKQSFMRQNGGYPHTLLHSQMLSLGVISGQYNIK
jgi:hypothetical protein